MSLAVGTQTVGLSTVWRAVVDYTDTGDEWIVRELRIPRTVLGIVVGIAQPIAATPSDQVGAEDAVTGRRKRCGQPVEVAPLA